MGLFDRSPLLANPQAWEKLVDPGPVSNALTYLLCHLAKARDISYLGFLTTRDLPPRNMEALLRLLRKHY